MKINLFIPKNYLIYSFLILFSFISSCKKASVEVTEEASATEAVDSAAAVDSAVVNPMEVEVTPKKNKKYEIEFCCSNHNPSHCTTKIKEMEKLSVNYNCTFK